MYADLWNMNKTSGLNSGSYLLHNSAGWVGLFSSKSLAYLVKNMICDVGVIRVKEFSAVMMMMIMMMMLMMLI